MVDTYKMDSKFNQSIRLKESLICVGLDPPLGTEDILAFNKRIVDATVGSVACYKLQLAFYEVLGPKGLSSMQETIDYIRFKDETIPIIGDAKRSDVGNTSKAYAKSFFDYYRFDAVTVNPYMGWDSIAPYLEYENGFVFVLCHTSNEGANDFQELNTGGGEKLYERVAKLCVSKGGSKVGLVVGATYPLVVSGIRKMFPSTTILAPGVGPQGGSLSELLKVGVSKNKKNLLINLSRAVSTSPDPKAYVKKFNEDIKKELAFIYT